MMLRPVAYPPVLICTIHSVPPTQPPAPRHRPVLQEPDHPAGRHPPLRLAGPGPQRNPLQLPRPGPPVWQLERRCLLHHRLRGSIDSGGRACGRASAAPAHCRPPGAHPRRRQRVRGCAALADHPHDTAGGRDPAGPRSVWAPPAVWSEAWGGRAASYRGCVGWRARRYPAYYPSMILLLSIILYCMIPD